MSAGFLEPVLVDTVMNNLTYAQATGGVGSGADSWVIDAANDLFANFDGAAYRLFWLASYVIGILFCVTALTKAAKVAQMPPGSQGGGYGAPLTAFIIGAFFVSFPSVLEILVNTMSDGQDGLLSYEGVEASLLEHVGDAGEKIIGAAIMLVQFVGALAVMKGFYLLKLKGEGHQQAGTGRSLTHIIGGTMALNIISFTNTISNMAINQDVLGGTPHTF